MSTMSEDRGAAALLCPASTGPAQPTMAEQATPAAYKYSREKSKAGANGSSLPPHARAGGHGVISITEFLDRILNSRLLSTDEVDRFLASQPGLVESNTDSLVEAFVTQGLLTEYQITRLLSG